LTYAPQLVEDARRVRRAQRLRGRSGRGVREVARMVVPVLEGALERALELAASMESRGYGRSVRRASWGRTRTLALVGLGGVVAGLYGLLDGGSPPAVGLPVLMFGLLASAAALWTGARRDARSHYRPDPWALPEWLTVGSGVLAAGIVMAGAQAGLPGIVPATSPASFPQLPWQAVVGVLVALVPAVASPVPPLRAALQARRLAPAPEGAPA
jgi:energy-coupling factor transport system permease protein